MAGIMAASAAREDLSAGWKDDPQSNADPNPTSVTTRGLELGMAGMNLISSNSASGNTKGRSPIPNSGDSVHSIHSTGTANSNQGDSFGGVNNKSRPPGMVPPIGKPGHNKTSSSSSTAHTATLTPTSSVDGGASNDLFVGAGARAQSSPSSGDHLPGIGKLGSFDTDDVAGDGFIGLHGLRERAQSSPGPPMNTNGNSTSYANSPREFSANARGFVPARPRLPSKDNGRSMSVGSTRPPLAGSSNISPHNMVEGMGFQSSGTRSRDASPPPNAGVISRPEPHFSSYGGGGGNANDSFESINLRRALSNDSIGGSVDYNNTYSGHRQSSDHLSSTFSQVSLTNQHRGGQIPGLYSNQGPQSQRSLPGQDYYHEANYEAGFIPHRTGNSVDGDYSIQQHHHQDMSYLHHTTGGHQQQYSRGPHRRSMSMQHSSYNENDLGQGGYAHQRRGSMGVHEMSRRGSEFGVGTDRSLYDQRERLGSTTYHRQDNRMVSPAHSPMQASYGSNHNRHHSDMSSISSTSPAMSLGSVPLYGRHRLTHTDEDLSHPLAGENIEVPGEDQYYNEGIPYQRSASMGHAPSYGSDSRHLPTAGASMQAPKIVYNVKFKRTQRTFEIGPRLNRDLKVGTYVKVEADRGEDLGIVIGKVKNPVTRSASFGGGMGEIPTAGAGGGGDLKKIIRLATHDEVGLLSMKRKEEDELLEVCRHKVLQRGMPMVVVDAEYQFDRHKLTFFFEANTRIDFRELVRDLFSIYKTRIWMQQLDKNTSATCPTAPAPAPLVMDYGTPIIAPVSEYEGFAQTSGASDNGTE